MIQISCLGDMCPIPVMKLQLHKEAIEQGETIMIICDHSCSTANITDYAKKHHFAIEINEAISGVWEIKVYKPLAQ